MGQLKKKTIISQPLSLKDFYKKHNQILIWHDKGGLGDVLMQRMLFRDFKKLCPDSHLIFACLPEYMDAVRDHKDIQEVIDSRTVDPSSFCHHYNTCVSIADRYENLNAPCLENRADIWAKYCGVTLKEHDMGFNLDQNLIKICKSKLQKLVNQYQKIVLFSPVSKMAVKSLLPWQIQVIKESIPNDAALIGLHNKEIGELTKLKIPGIYDATIKEWMHYLAAADYVIAVDTAALHMAGGLKKPLTGIFTFADGKVYGKYYNFILVQKHRDNGNWTCGPCFKFMDCPKCDKMLKPCLTELTAEELSNGVKEMFNRWSQK